MVSKVADSVAESNSGLMLTGQELFYAVYHTTYQLLLAESSQKYLETEGEEIHIEKGRELALNMVRVRGVDPTHSQKPSYNF